MHDTAQSATMKRWLYLLPAIIYMGVIFWMSCHPAPESLRKFPIWGEIKAVHLIEYGMLALLWVWGLQNATQWIWRKAALYSVSITFLWGISDEIHQAFVPGRSAKVSDALTDLLAALLVIGGLAIIRGMRGKLCYKSDFKQDEEAP